MSRFLLLIILGAWMSWAERASSLHAVPLRLADLSLPCIFLAGFATFIAVMAFWARRLTRRIDSSHFSRHLRQFNRAMGYARVVVPIWYIVGVFFLGWGTLIASVLSATWPGAQHYDTPGLLLGCLPAFAGWIGLWWAQYPADISLREQGMLSQLDDGIPVHRPPSLACYIRVNLRLQLLFTLAPVLALVLLRDVVGLALEPLHLIDSNASLIQLAVSLGTAAVVFIASPEILKRVLDTQPLADGPLRRRLEQVCRRHHIRYRDMLLWRTEHQMGNAAVMGLIPQVRYILMSDLLLETMTDEQIEAVFAHEIGHVVHRHLLWFAVYFAAAMFAMICIVDPATALLSRWFGDADWPSLTSGLLSGGAMLFLFFWISRRFERQADVFAGRAIQQQLRSDRAPIREPVSDRAVDPDRVISLAGASGMAGIMLQAISEPVFTRRETPLDRPAVTSHVGLYGSTVFAEALHQVARVNCISLHAWSWCHGSMQSRIRYLQSLTRDPQHTSEFDAAMGQINLALICSLALFGGWAAWTLLHSA